MSGLQEVMNSNEFAGTRSLEYIEGYKDGVNNISCQFEEYVREKFFTGHGLNILPEVAKQMSEKPEEFIDDLLSWISYYNEWIGEQADEREGQILEADYRARLKY